MMPVQQRQANPIRKSRSEHAERGIVNTLDKRFAASLLWGSHLGYKLAGQSPIISASDAAEAHFSCPVNLTVIGTGQEGFFTPIGEFCA